MSILACHSITAILCIVALYVTTPSRLAGALLPYSAGPLAVASVALGIAAFLRSARGWVEQVIAGLWGVGAVAASVHLSSPPLHLEDVFRYVEIQGLFATLAAAGVFVAAVGQLKHLKNHWRFIQGLALLALAAFFLRRSAQGLGFLPKGGIAEIAFEMRLAQSALLGCSAVLVTTALAGWARERRA